MMTKTLGRSKHRNELFRFLFFVIFFLFFFVMETSAIKKTTTTTKRKNKRSSTWQGNAATKDPDAKFVLFREREERELEMATFSSGNAANAEARFGCLKGVYRTIVGHSSVNDNWRERFKNKNKNDKIKKNGDDDKDERVLIQGHRISGDDVETVRVYYEGGISTYQTLVYLHFSMLEPEPWIVKRGQGDSQMYAHSLYPHTKDQFDIALKKVNEKREHRKGPNGETIQTKIVINLEKDDGTMNFRPMEMEKQKSLFTARPDLKQIRFKWAHANYFENAEWVYNSTKSMFLNSYLAGACAQNDHDGFEKPHDNVEDTLKSFQLELEHLESLGLVHLHPNVVMVPPLGGLKQLKKDKEEMQRRQQRIKDGLPEFEEPMEGFVPETTKKTEL